MKSGPKPKPIEERFFSKVIKPESGCWGLKGFKDRDGYGYIRISPQRLMRVHRFSFWYHHIKTTGISMEEFNDSDVLVCHSCDNPECCNPEHLFQGTEKDNTRDMITKGRRFNNRGETHGCAKLTEAKVLEIFKSKDKQCVLALRYGVTFQMIHRIKRRKAWTYLTDGIEEV